MKKEGKSKMKILMPIIFIIFLLQSCSIENNIYGTYAIREKSTLYRFDINKNGTFYYLSGGGWLKIESFGTYQFSTDGRKIIFDSYINDINAIPISVTETNIKDNDSILIVFNKPMMSIKETYPNHTGYFENAATGRKYEHGEYDSLYYDIIINDTLKYSIYSDSISLPKKLKIDNFYFTMRGYFEELFTQPLQDTARTIKYYIKDISNNVFLVHFDFPKLKWSSIFFQVPINDTLSIKRNALYWKKEKLKLKKTR
ncbi:MAG: hypothetical protein LBL74_04530 [Bacteroidales bacterium]|jgi:hypothetical protein|nr:hypothetical protein [Bacteroidales bacterium]